MDWNGIYLKKWYFRSWIKQQTLANCERFKPYEQNQQGLPHMDHRIVQRILIKCQNVSESFKQTLAAASATFHFCLMFLLCHGLLQCTNQLFVASGHFPTMIFLRPTTASNTAHNAAQRHTMQHRTSGLFPTTSNQVHVCWVWKCEFDLWEGCHCWHLHDTFPNVSPPNETLSCKFFRST